MYFFCFNNYYKCIVAKLFKRTALYIYNTAGPVTGQSAYPHVFYSYGNRRHRLGPTAPPALTAAPSIPFPLLVSEKTAYSAPPPQIFK